MKNEDLILNKRDQHKLNKHHQTKPNRRTKENGVALKETYVVTFCMIRAFTSINIVKLGVAK